jgi:hypothetical protein
VKSIVRLFVKYVGWCFLAVGGVFQLLAEKVVYAPKACGGELAYASGAWEGIWGFGDLGKKGNRTIDCARGINLINKIRRKVRTKT